MNTYKRHRFPPEIISYAVWLYFRFNLSHRDIEDLLAQRGIIVSYESIRLWCIKFGRIYARRLKLRHQGYGDTFYIDEVFVKINGKQHYLWRAVDQVGGTGTAISDYPRGGVHSFQPWTSSCQRWALQRTQDRCLWTMDNGRCLIPDNEFLLGQKS